MLCLLVAVGVWNTSPDRFGQARRSHRAVAGVRSLTDESMLAAAAAIARLLLDLPRILAMLFPIGIVVMLLFAMLGLLDLD